MTNACVSRFSNIRAAGAPLKRRHKFEVCYLRFFSTYASPAASALIHSPTSLLLNAKVSPSDAPQRSAEWFAFRRDKLTTSTFSTALGFWKGNRRYDLWHEKVFTSEGHFIEAAVRHAMEWGVVNEAAAIERYKSITGHDVSSYGLAVHPEERFQWLGASPDGLLGGGILEVKCPYNKGKPEMGLPWNSMPYYYMPQVQGQMEIMDRDWVDLYCWTPNGSTIFRVHRERDYWVLMHEILREFWWENVIPAREALLLGKQEEAKSYMPMSTHRHTGFVIARSRQLASEARLLYREVAGHAESFQ